MMAKIVYMLVHSCLWLCLSAYDGTKMYMYRLTYVESVANLTNLTNYPDLTNLNS